MLMNRILPETRVNELPTGEDGIIRFDTVPGVMDRRRDRWTDRQTDRIAVAKTALSVAACCKENAAFIQCIKLVSNQ